MVRSSIDFRVELKDNEGEGVERDQEALRRLDPNCKEFYTQYLTVWALSYNERIERSLRRKMRIRYAFIMIILAVLSWRLLP